MSASPEMPKIAIKTGVVAAVSALAISGSPEQSMVPASAEATVSPATDLVTRELGHTSVEAVMPPPSAYRSEPQAQGPQDPRLKHHRRYVRPVKVPRVLRAIRGCESSSGAFAKPNYRVVNSSGHGGAYQFAVKTWAYFHGYARAENAPPKTQDRKAVQTLHESGTQPWDASISCWGRVVAPVAPRR